MGREQFELKDKIAIVTGASGGLGKALAYAFSDMGAKVVLASRNFDKLEKISADIMSRGHECLAVKVDVVNHDEIHMMVQATIKKFKRIDILVNNAASFLSKNLLDTTEEEWDFILNTNLKGTYLCSQLVCIEMCKSNSRGKIINISSIFGFIGASRMVAYAASKGGVIQLTRSLALELARYNINVNCIAPGLFMSPLNTKAYSNKEFLQNSLRRIPLRREAKMEEITGTALFLACDASNYITGCTIPVDGGWSIDGDARK